MSSAGAQFDYEKIVASKLPFMDRNEAYDYLGLHSTRYILSQVGVSDEVVAEARAIIGAPATSTSKAASALSSKGTVASWYDSGKRLRSDFVARAPSGWGIVPIAGMANSVEVLEVKAAALANLLVENPKTIDRLLQEMISARASIPSVQADIAAVKAALAVAEAELAIKAEAPAEAPAAKAPPTKQTAAKSQAADNQNALGGLAALALAAAAYFYTQNGGDPAAIGTVAATAGLA